MTDIQSSRIRQDAMEGIARDELSGDASIFFRFLPPPTFPFLQHFVCLSIAGINSVS